RSKLSSAIKLYRNSRRSSKTATRNRNRRTNSTTRRIQTNSRSHHKRSRRRISTILTCNVLLPCVDAGTVNVADKPPVEVVVETLKDTATPPKVAVTECEPTKP